MGGKRSKGAWNRKPDPLLDDSKVLLIDEVYLVEQDAVGKSDLLVRLINLTVDEADKCRHPPHRPTEKGRYYRPIVPTTRIPTLFVRPSTCLRLSLCPQDSFKT